jgi:hypothetical protein
VKVSLTVKYCVAVVPCVVASRKLDTMQGLSACFAVVGHRNGHHGQRARLCLIWHPQQTPRRLMFQWMRGGHDGARPANEKEVRLARPFVSHMVSVDGPNSRKNYSPQLAVATSRPAPTSPALTSPAWLAQTLLLFTIHAARVCLEHPCHPSLTFSTTSSVPSFISCVRQFVIWLVTIQNITEARNIEISF